MEIKTCDEYVINELEKTKEELFLVNKVIEELQEKLEAYNSADSLTLDEKSGVFYSFHVTSYYNMEELLEKLIGKDFSLEDAKSCLDDDIKLNKLMSVKARSWSSENKVKEYNYQNLLTYSGRDYAITITEDSCHIFKLDDKQNYHADKKSLAEKNILEEFKENLNKYIESEEKKMEEKKNGSK